MKISKDMQTKQEFWFGLLNFMTELVTIAFSFLMSFPALLLLLRVTFIIDGNHQILVPTSLAIDLKFDTGDYVGRITHTQKTF